jgi:ABC-2 type transport system permease protein
VCAAAVAATGLAIGWRPSGSIGGAIGGFALFLFFAYALSWACACLGMVSKGPESAQGIGLATLFPLAILSDALDARLSRGRGGSPGSRRGPRT